MIIAVVAFILVEPYRVISQWLYKLVFRGLPLELRNLLRLSYLRNHILLFLNYAAVANYCRLVQILLRLYLYLRFRKVVRHVIII